jgi:hypothetical protein
VIDLESGERVLISDELWGSYAFDALDWLPDGRLAYGVMHQGEQGASPQLWTVQADGSDLTLLWEGKLERFGSVTWIPGTGLILFSVDPGGYADENLSYRVISMEGATDKEIMVGGNPASISISHDGRQILRYVTRFSYDPLRLVGEEFVLTTLDY